jgi:hypothetical protein
MPDLLLCFQKIMADLVFTYKVGFPDRLRTKPNSAKSIAKKVKLYNHL